MIFRRSHPQSTPLPRSSRAGLSLFELLLSLALLAAISAAIASSLGLSLRVYDRSQELDNTSTPITARLHLRSYLHKAAVPFLMLPFETGFSGQPEGFRFTSLATSGLAPDAAGLRVAVRLDGETLVMQVDQFSDLGAVMRSETRILAETVTDLRFAYYNTAASPPAWQNTWPTSDPNLPQAIRITAAPGSTPDWPDFVVRLRLGVQP
ncbi:hypothetical protein J7443_22450 [Tropicibacter sp. R15_0]|uniref:type II secretion system protein GspJ n=1 Tax=Tropicibacter sp. R15_0 TaxID=2821101 RepID=UPI001ADB6ED1|nr:type II secretion system protein GspJ [Tropicibacter sp. R15_0]MBO9468009.1 hypothetical protein [Tropicibacter sp. R15_0]